MVYKNVAGMKRCFLALGSCIKYTNLSATLMHIIPTTTNPRRILTTHFQGIAGRYSSSFFNVSTTVTTTATAFFFEFLSRLLLHRCGDWTSKEA